MNLLTQAQAIAAKDHITLQDLEQLDSLQAKALGQRSQDAERIGDLIEAAMLNASEEDMEAFLSHGEA